MRVQAATEGADVAADAGHAQSHHPASEAEMADSAADCHAVRTLAALNRDQAAEQLLAHLDPMRLLPTTLHQLAAVFLHDAPTPVFLISVPVAVHASVPVPVAVHASVPVAVHASVPVAVLKRLSACSAPVPVWAGKKLERPLCCFHPAGQVCPVQASESFVLPC